MRKLNAADLFCGAGGTSIGAEQSGAAKVRFAVNHWDVAVRTHSANFPHAKHVNSRLDQVQPGECPKIDLLFASPECTHHSRARGGKPTSDQQRAGAWELLPWLNHHRPSYLVVENVVEFAEWGPVGDNGRPLKRFKGKLFSAWLAAIQAEGYRVDCAKLNAADFGAATSRERLFVVARKGNRSPVFPEATHGKNPGRALPGMQRLQWRAAAEIIDWSIPCPSIFSRTRPLADKTLARIEAGLRRFVAVPLVMSTLGGGITASNPKCVAVPYLVSTNHGDTRHTGGRTEDLAASLGTITGANGRGIAVPFLCQHYSSGGQWSAVDRPVPTIPTVDRHGLTLAIIDPCCLPWPEPHSDAMASLQRTMCALGVADIGFRMLANHELSAAQGFPADYIFAGNKSEITRQIGNSVSPNVAKAITEVLSA